MRFSPMWLSGISEKVVRNLRLAGGSLWALRLPPPPETNIPDPPLLSHSIASFLYRQTLSMHVEPNKIGVKLTTLKVGVGILE